MFSEKYKKYFSLYYAVQYCIIYAKTTDTSVICKKVIAQFKEMLTDFELVICWDKP